MKKLLASLITFSCIALSSAPAADPDNLLKNSDFSLADSNGQPSDWVVSHPNFLQANDTVISLEAEPDGRTYYRVTKNAATGVGIGWQEIIVPENATNLLIKAKIRGEGIVRGAENWHLPGIGVTYFFSDSEDDARPGDVSRWITIPTGDTGWEEYESIVPVRPGAKRAQITIIGAGWTGTADFTDVVAKFVE